ncbi:protealysin inhibitor emfourin [Frankia sp. AgKG'84/4]|uniref:protealysin inhibitor emfourin n=1 Tax=Frankia sp. AgKG'84/4 TaxID=573490 RepID=UPI00200BE74B|nr:protealysin inhibitor emfourin [Frankia sp. AgKG'84/4]MCL9794428.1 hypothetical protein [Frankia sp. AgKG'84/4]
MAGEPARVRVALTRSGGLLGRPTRRGLDTANLSAQEATRLRHLVEKVWDGAADAPVSGVDPGPGADRYTHVLEIDRAGERYVQTFTEAVPAQLRSLVDLLRAAPRLPPGGAPPR